MGKKTYSKPRVDSTDVEFGVYGRYDECPTGQCPVNPN